MSVQRRPHSPRAAPWSPVAVLALVLLSCELPLPEGLPSQAKPAILLEAARLPGSYTDVDPLWLPWYLGETQWTRSWVFLADGNGGCTSDAGSTPFTWSLADQGAWYGFIGLQLRSRDGSRCMMAVTAPPVVAGVEYVELPVDFLEGGRGGCWWISGHETGRGLVRTGGAALP